MTLRLSCDHCGEAFSTYPSYARRRARHFCSPACSSAYHSKSNSVERPCISCGKPVVRARCYADRRPYCSPACRQAARKSLRHGTNACYNQERCRCAACRQANAARQRAYQTKKRLALAKEGSK